MMTDVRYDHDRSGTVEEIAQAKADVIAKAEAAVAKENAKLAQLRLELGDREAELALGIKELEELPDPVLIELPVMSQDMQDYLNYLRRRGRFVR
jgi:folylpolyglutamate synthase/dihydropteroate synthase